LDEASEPEALAGRLLPTPAVLPVNERHVTEALAK
jgi:hypothetical protein